MLGWGRFSQAHSQPEANSLARRGEIGAGGILFPMASLPRADLEKDLGVEPPMITQYSGEGRWDGVPVLPYKEDGTLFKSITRQLLFPGAHDLPVELRYFEIGPEGHSTLERHDHAHLVVVNRGAGRVLVRDAVFEIGLNDVVQIPPLTWHQFRPLGGETFGFLCVVSAERDRPQRPSAAELEMLQSVPEVAEFIRV